MGLNREEIIKALEWCIQSESCEYCEYNEGKADVCNIRSDALSLIKQLAEENESLKANAVPRSECEKWYAEYHKVKEDLKQEKMYHRSTEKLADRYLIELKQAKQDVAREIMAEFKDLVISYVKDRGLLLGAFKNAVAHAEAELKKKYIGE